MRVIEDKFWDVTILSGKFGNKYYLVQAESAEEAAQACKQFGEVDNIRKVAANAVLLKEIK